MTQKAEQERKILEEVQRAVQERRAREAAQKAEQEKKSKEVVQKVHAEKKIRGFENYTERNCEVIFEDGSREVVDSKGDLFYTYLAQYAKDKGLDLISLVKKITFDEIKKKRGKGKNVVKNLAVAGTIITLMIGGIHIERHKGFKNIKNLYIKDNSYNELIESYNENYETNYEFDAKAAIENHSLTESVIRCYSQYKIKNYENWDLAINNIIITVNCNMSDISNYLQDNNRGLAESPLYVDYSPLFTNENDIKAVKAYCEMRNNILRAAYEENDFRHTMDSIGELYYQTMFFINDRVPLNFGTEEYRYMVSADYLSPMAKNIIGTIAEAALRIDANFFPTINKKTFNKTVTLDNVVEFTSRALLDMNTEGYHR